PDRPSPAGEVPARPFGRPTRVGNTRPGRPPAGGPRPRSGRPGSRRLGAAPRNRPRRGPPVQRSGRVWPYASIIPPPRAAWSVTSTVRRWSLPAPRRHRKVVRQPAWGVQEPSPGRGASAGLPKKWLDEEREVAEVKWAIGRHDPGMWARPQRWLFG